MLLPTIRPVAACAVLAATTLADVSAAQDRERASCLYLYQGADRDQRLVEKAKQEGSRAVDSPLNKFRYELIDPALMLDEWDRWARLWSSLFLGGKEVKPGE